MSKLIEKLSNNKRIFIMKKLLIILIGLISPFLFSQNEFKLDKNTPMFPFQQVVVIETDSLSIQAAYAKVLDWAELRNETTTTTITSKIENKQIIIEGFEEELYYSEQVGIGKFYNTKYKLGFIFKLGKIGIMVSNVSVLYPSNENVIRHSEGWTNVSYLSKNLYDKNGELLIERKEKYYRIINFFNTVVEDLREFLL